MNKLVRDLCVLQVTALRSHFHRPQLVGPQLVSLLSVGILLAALLPSGCLREKEQSKFNSSREPGTADVSVDKAAPVVTGGKLIPKVNVGNLREAKQEVFVDALTSNAAVWKWEQLAGPGTLDFQSPSAEDTAITASADGFYWVRLTVTSEDGSSAFDDFELLWDTTAPSLQLSPEIRAFQPLHINASIGSDAASIQWSQLAGPGQVTFSAPQSKVTTLSADVNGVYTLRLKVADRLGNETHSDMSFIWETGVPAVSLGQDIITNKEIAFDASTLEADTFLWSQVSGPGLLAFSSATVEDTKISASADGAYVLRLTITTAGGATASDEIQFVWDTKAPSIELGQDMSLKYRATIDAVTSGSVSFAWSKLAGPGQVMFSAPSSEDTALIVDQAGLYEIVLTVADEAGNVATDRLNINFEYDIRVFAKQVSSGGSHSCAVLDDDSVACWGYNYEQELGYGVVNKFGEGVDHYMPPSFPVNLGKGMTARAVSANYAHSCAILSDESVKCWGQGSAGQLGYGDALRRNMPPAASINLGPMRQAKTIATGFFHSCAILDGGSLKCWGMNAAGQLGYGDFQNRLAPPAETVDLGMGRTVKSISVGGYHTCALLDDESVKCWGANTNGELGLGDTIRRNKPELLSLELGGPVRGLTSGSYHNCAVLDNAQVKCWGRNRNGQLGYGDSIGRLQADAAFADLGAGRRVRSLSAGYAHTCALMEDNAVQCWGSNSDGQLGYGDLMDRFSAPQQPLSFGENRVAKSISAGRFHNCAVLDDNTVKCWGSNAYGQLGSGKVVDGSTPPPAPIAYGD